jgi:hypothetical protein
MHLEKIDITVPDLPNNTPFYASRKTPKGFPPLHLLNATIGARGTGKTSAVLKMLKAYVDCHSYDRLYWWSPTAKREQKFRDFQSYCEKKGVEIVVFDTFSNQDLADTIEHLRAEIDRYKEYLTKLEIWNKFVRVKTVDAMTLDELMELDQMGWQKPTTEYKYGWPSHAAVFDDCGGQSQVYRADCKGIVASTALLHRHVGLSMFFLIQIVANGVPRGIRSNISCWQLFPCRSKKLQAAVAEELAFKVSPETLMAVWDFATKDNPHDFLFADYDSPVPDFRRNFTHRIILDKNVDDDNKTDEQDDSGKIP